MIDALIALCAVLAGVAALIGVAREKGKTICRGCGEVVEIKGTCRNCGTLA